MAHEDQTKRRKLVGYDNFVRHNPKSDKFELKHFHHVEFYCQDATNMARRFGFGLGMNLVAKSDQSTGNHSYASYVVQSGSVVFTFTAPYSKKTNKPKHVPPHPHFDMVRSIVLAVISPYLNIYRGS